MPSFRKAEFGDVIFIARLLREFYQKQGDVYGIAWNHADAIGMIDDVVRRGVCIIGDTSCGGALLTPFPYNSKALIANVAFWYFVKPREIKIFEALIGCCLIAGATHVNPSSHFPDNRIGRFYRKMGIQPTETQYLAPIEQVIKGCKVS